jgi:hypothetical protein
MKYFLIAATLVAVTSFSTAAVAADVGVSVNIGQPGFYGRLDIGNFPQPQVLYRQPMRVERGSMDRPPIYMRVPSGHARQWRKHCREYNACGERVFFVQNRWYNREYVPHYQQQQQDRRGDDGRHGGSSNNQGYNRGQGHNR